MRGFPLIGSLIVLALFAVSWPIMRATIGGRVEATVVESEVESSEAEKVDAVDKVDRELVAIRVVGSAKMSRLRIEYLGEPLIDASPEQAQFEQPLVNFAFPGDGVDFWIEAEFGDDQLAAEDAAPIAVRLEVEDENGEVYQISLWSDGESGIADSVFVPAFEKGNQ